MSTQYVIADWAGNICFNSKDNQFDTFDDAHDYLEDQVVQQMLDEGVDPKNDKLYFKYLEEYYVIPLEDAINED